MPTALRSKIHSKFFPEVAEAMAEQWSEEFLSKYQIRPFYHSILKNDFNTVPRINDLRPVDTTASPFFTQP